MSIYSDHQKLVDEAKKRHRMELEELDHLLEIKQQSCNHQWVRYEDLFYALGETYPGESCSECGKQRRIQ